MQKSILLATVITFRLIAYDLIAANGLTWIQSLDEGQKLAKSEGKDLFILFTGHGWCHKCELVDREVFQRPEFIDATVTNYVFVELDFNFGDSPDEEKRKTEFMQLRDSYLASTVPTEVLTDCDGLPYSFITGYYKISGPHGYLNHVVTAQSAKAKRDELLSATASKFWKSRAELLNDALDCIAPDLLRVE